jgi:hypothetical protein
MSIAPEPYLSAYLEVMCETITFARSLAYENSTSVLNRFKRSRSAQLADLMDAIHIIPELLNEWERCNEPSLRETYLAAYDKKWARGKNTFSMMAVFNKVYSRVQAGKPKPPTRDEMLNA